MFDIKLNLFAIAGLSVAIVCFLLSFFIFVNAKGRLPRLWALFNLSVGVFGFGTFLAGISQTYEQAYISWKITLFGVSFIAMFFYHVVYEFCHLNNKKLLTFAYIHAILFATLGLFTDTIFHSLRFAFNQFYYYQAGIGFNLLFPIWLFFVFNAFVNLFLYLGRAKGLKLTQGKYLFWGMLLGFLGGATTSFPSWGFDIYPAWHFFICVYIAISTYAIFKYQLMDIRLAITRLSVFALVYTIILGLPLGLVFLGKTWLINLLGEEWFWVPMLTLVALATPGPFIFLYLQRKAESILLQEEQRTQDLLIQASYGMNIIHNLEKLLNLIIEVVSKTLRIDSASIYLLNRDGDQYILRAPQSSNEVILHLDNSLIEYLKSKQYPLVYDEIKAASEMKEDSLISDLESQMKKISASIIVPITLNNSLLGFLILGDRKSKEMYTKGLLNTLSILGNQAAVAIDRCNYIAAETKRLEAEGLKERMVSLDHMAASMAHEIDNPMHIISQSLSFAKFVMTSDQRLSEIPAEIKKDINDAISRSLHAGERVSVMVKAILDYAKMGTGKLQAIQIKESLDGFLQLISPQIKEERVQFKVEIEENLPPILGDKIQLEEIFMNFVRNSMHAVKRREEKLVILKIYQKDFKFIRIECKDNGYGIEKHFLNDMFLSSTTTKGSSEGTGLGLFRVRKIVDTFGGKVWGESEGKDKGATLIVEFPIYLGDKIADIDAKNSKKGE